MAAHRRIQNLSPLMYEWYGEHYVGPAHGLAGIYYYLMQVGLLTGTGTACISVQALAQLP